MVGFKVGNGVEVSWGENGEPTTIAFDVQSGGWIETYTVKLNRALAPDVPASPMQEWLHKNKQIIAEVAH